MGKLKKLYGDVEKTVPLTLPVSGVVLKFHRPDYGEEQEISKKLRQVNDSGDEDASEYLLMAAARVLKLLCDEPNLREDNEVDIMNDLKSFEAPDRNCILPFYASLVRVDDEDTLTNAVARQLLARGTRTQS